MTNEPEDSSYVAVKVASGILLLYRDDQLAADLDLPKPDVRHWFRAHDPTFPASWADLCSFGPVAYVGTFVDRSSKERE